MKYQIRYKDKTIYYLKDGIAYKDLDCTKQCKCPLKAFLIGKYDSFDEMELRGLLLQDVGKSDETFLAANGYVEEGRENLDF